MCGQKDPKTKQENANKVLSREDNIKWEKPIQFSNFKNGQTKNFSKKQ